VVREAAANRLMNPSFSSTSPTPLMPAVSSPGDQPAAAGRPGQERRSVPPERGCGPADLALLTGASAPSLSFLGLGGGQSTPVARPWDLPMKSTAVPGGTINGWRTPRMTQRPARETVLVEILEEVIDDYRVMAADGMSDLEITLHGQHLQAALTQIDLYRQEEQVLTSLKRCGLRGEWARRELVRIWATKQDDDDRTPPPAVSARSQRLEACDVSEDLADAA
jgi:hypothetical protein